MKPSYQWWIDDLVEALPKRLSVKNLVEYWYDQSDRKIGIRLMDLLLLEALIRKWHKR